MFFHYMAYIVFLFLIAEGISRLVYSQSIIYTLRDLFCDYPETMHESRRQRLEETREDLEDVKATADAQKDINKTKTQLERERKRLTELENKDE